VDMRESYYKNFRYTSRSAIVAAVGLAVVPLSVYYLLGNTTGLWKWDGKRKGESLRTIAPAPEASE